jgi:Ca-activated chloride channel homolog
MHLLRHAFAHPLILFALLALPVLAVLALRARRRRLRVLAQFGATGLRSAVLAAVGKGRWLRGVCFALGLVLLGLACAGPQWGRDWNQAAAPGRDVVVVLDMSRSMLAEQPSRLERATRALADLSDALEQRGGHRLALVVFAGRPRIVCPLTHDYDHFRDALEGLTLEPPTDLTPPNAVSGTRIGLALREAIGILEPGFQGYQDVVLISDGDDPERDNEWQAGIRAARDRDIPIHVVGVGDPDAASTIPLPESSLAFEGEVVTTKLEEGPLRDIARLTGGVYVPAHTKALPLGKLFREQMEQRAVRDSDPDALPLLHQRAPWFFFAALAFLTLEILAGGGWRFRLRSARTATEPVTSVEVVS